MFDRTQPMLISCGVGVACFTLLLATSRVLPMGWDEGNAIHRAEGIQHWFSGFGESLTRPFTVEAINADWRYTTQVEGHPAFYGAVIALGKCVSRSWLTPLDAARFGPIMLFSLAVAAATYRLWRIASPVAALAGAAALVTLPRLFTHAHFASFDGPLTSCWLFAWATFDPALSKPRWSTLWGVALGLTMSCKFTGWIAVVPFVFWVVTFGDRRAARALAIGVPVAAMTFWAVNPPLWHQPLAGLEKFFEMNLGRADHVWLNIPTTYFGARYDARTPLPWHNALVWTAITVPAGTLALFGLGLGRALRNWRARPEWMLLVGHWAVLVVVRSTPWAPPHDGERLFLPSFAFLAMLAGLGGDALWAWARRGGSLRGWFGRSALAAALAGSVSSTIWYAPQWLSYYNVLVGGLRGANALGMEPTYYWDGLDAEVLAWLDEHTADDEKIAFGSSSPENWDLMRQWGSLRVACFTADPGRCRWYVIQRRPSTLSDAERRLIARARPAFRKTIRPPGAGWGPWRVDVPIVEVYDYAVYEQALVGP